MSIGFRGTILLCALLAASFSLVGCGRKALEDYETRLKTLETNGTPDSLLSTIRVHLMQAKAGKQSSNGTLVRTSMDSLKATIAAAEKWYADATQATKAHVDGLVSTLTGKKKELTGLQLKEADSLLAAADSFIKKNWYIQARRFVDELDTLMPFLVKDEAAAKKVAAAIPGAWSMTNKLKQDGANAVEKKKVKFTKEGTFEMEESMNGQTSPSLKEDWKYQSSGTYGIKGDTILLSIQKEKCFKEEYQRRTQKGWVKNSKKPYDTVITNGAKDRFFTYEYLKEEFKK
jgi:cell division septum initiation protein DivIVA